MYLISFKESQFARAFVDYMMTKNVMIRLELDADGNSQLFLDNVDAEKLEFIKYELSRYVKNPYDKKYIDASWQTGEKKSFQIKKGSLNSFLPKIILVGPITTTIAIICTCLYLLLLLIGSSNLLDYLGYPIEEESVQFWRYITPVFIHFSLLHIAFNLMWWWYLGGMIEKRIGKFKLLELLLISGALSNYAEAITSGPYFGGLSGVVYALMGYVWLYGEKIKSSGLGIDRSMIGFAVIWLLAGYTGILGSIANTAHFVGFIVGLLLAAKDIWLVKHKTQ